jgi:hypothetical protein
MPYPRRLISAGEEVVIDLNPHWMYFFRQIVFSIPLFLLFLFTLSQHGTVQKGLWYLDFLAFVVWAGYVVLRWLAWRSTYFVVTTERIISRTGVIARTGHEIPLDRVNDINFRQRLWERMVGAGSLVIESAGEAGQSRFTDITNPEYVQQEIYRQIENHQTRRDQKSYDIRQNGLGGAMAGQAIPPPGAFPGYPQPAPGYTPGPGGYTGAPAGPPHAPPAPPVVHSIPEQLSQLADLRDRGVLTPEEFERKKQELLGRM